MSSPPSLTGGYLFCDEIPRSGRGMIQDLGNSRILVIASEVKQSLEILNFALGILDFCSLLV